MFLNFASSILKLYSKFNLFFAISFKGCLHSLYFVPVGGLLGFATPRLRASTVDAVKNPQF